MLAGLLSLCYSITVTTQNRLPEPVIFPTSAFEHTRKILQDDRGFLWLSTNRGLFCFDGSFFRKITHPAEAASVLDNGQILDMCFDGLRKVLWLATPLGISTLDLITETFADLHLEHPQLHNSSCSALTQDRTGRIWMAVEDFGLVCYNDSVQYFPMPRRTVAGRENAVPDIYKVAQDAVTDSIIWLATGFTGLVRFDTRDGKYFIPEQDAIAELPNGIIFTNVFPVPGKVLLGSLWSNNSYYYEQASGVFRRFYNKNSNSGESAIKFGFIKRHGPSSVWGYNQLGLFVFDYEKGSIIQQYRNPADIISLHGILVAARGIWAGSELGLLWYDLTSYKVENHFLPADENGKPHHLISAIDQEESDYLWLSFQTSDHIYEYERTTRTYRSVAVAAADMTTPGVLFDSPEGHIYALAANDLYRLQEGRLVHLPLFRDLLDSGVQLTRPHFDQSGTLWIGSRWGGIYQLDLTTGHYKDHLAGAGFRGAPDIFPDSQGNIWAAREGGGGFFVLRPREGTILQFPYRQDTQNTVYLPKGFEEDLHGNVWISDTRVGGLLRFHRDSLERGVLERHLSSKGNYTPYMYALKADTKGRIWAVTQEGLQVFDPERRSFTLFGESVGFQLRGKDRATSNFIPAYLDRLSSGELVVGYQNGFAIFHPDSLLATREQAQAYLVSMTIDGRKILGVTMDREQTLRISPQQDSPVFTYAALSPTGWKVPRFAYRLRGLDDRWTQTPERSVRYAKLSPGFYHFELQTVNSGGEGMGNVLSIPFRILAPWWARWWAYTIYGVIIALTVRTIYLWRKRRWQLQARLAYEHREAARLKELDQFKNKLYTNITHEFRTPLTVIRGMVEQMRERPKKWDTEGLHLIKKNADRLLQLVNQMLDLSKLEAGMMPVMMEQGDVIAFVRYVLESFHSLAAGKDIRLELIVEETAVLMDYDAEKLREIISNLVSNAIKFTPRGGTVTCLVSRMLPDNGPQHEQLVLRVKDTGIGIPEEKLPYIFDRFYSSEESGSGTGIGLALTKELVQLLGGEMKAQSRVGEGSEFVITLPILRTAIVPDKAGATSGQAKISKTVESSLLQRSVGKQKRPLLLIVEDNADVVRYLVACLEDNYRLLVADNGRKGCELAVDRVPDLIISDVMMPEMDGFTLCHTLKTDFRTSHIPVVLLTARADSASKIEGLQRGADAYLAKPFDRAELMVRLQKLLELRQRLQQYYSHHILPDATAGDITNGFPLEAAFMQRVRAVMKKHLDDEQFGVPELCRALNMSRSQLYRKFQALTDQPVGQYFRSLRLQRAIEMLRSTDHSISEIAFAVGFKDPAYFTNCFKEHFGKTPTEARNQRLEQ